MNSIKKIGKGFTLIELMVSLSIGIILLLALGSIYITANKSSKSRSTDEMLDETARQVFERLEQDIKLAGYIDIFDTHNAQSIANQVANFDNDQNKLNIARIIRSQTNPTNGTVSVNQIETPFFRVFQRQAIETNSPNSLTIRYQVFADNANASLHTRNSATVAGSNAENSGISEDCTGSRLVNSKFITNEYLLENNADGFPALRCRSTDGNNTRVRDIVIGVTSLHFRFLTTPENTDPNATLYTSYSGLYNNNIVEADAIPNTALGWAGVTGVEVCIVVAGEPFDQHSQAEIAQLQPNLPTCTLNNNEYDVSPRPRGNTKLYRRYVKVFNMPNAQYYTP